MLINLSKETYLVPEGIYRATLIEFIDFTETDKKNADLRFKWRINYPTVDGKVYLLGKNYKLDNQSILFNDLQSWFPDGLHQFEAQPGQLDLAKLVGQQADIVVGHKLNDNHALPFVYIRSVHPSGKLVKLPKQSYAPFVRENPV